jgi:hypothetical protein
VVRVSRIPFSSAKLEMEKSVVKSKLSDAEWTEVIGFCTADRWADLRLYLDQLLYMKGLGTDCCARPLALRMMPTKEPMAAEAVRASIDQPTCFALGYMQLIESYIEETDARETAPEVTIEKTLKYIGRLKEEINRFFKKG